MENSPISNNPWKGLNFYVEGEILYGRNSEIESLSQYIINNTQTVLYGKSGIGKSSILNAGIFPIARQHGMLPVGIRLDHSSSLPYIKQIQNAIISSGAIVHEVLPVIKEDEETLWEYTHRNVFFDSQGVRIQLLLVLDQFEEIFTLQQDEKKKRAFFNELGDLLNDVTPLYIVNANKGKDTKTIHEALEVTDSLDELDIDIDLEDLKTESTSKYLQKVDYHIVFTLREDFLSYLERYTAYIPVMKSNRYALLPINEEQAADIILKPRKGLVDKDVAELIIQKVTGKNNFTLNGIPEIDVDAAVLSLYLSRLYIKKGEDKPKITAELVRLFSDDIIKDFYEESVSDLPEKEVERIEDQLLTYDGRRNNVSRNDLIREGISKEVIRTLVEDRKLLRQFSYQDDIRIEFMHDILCPVVNARIDQREAARLQAEENAKAEQERQALLQRQKEELDRIERENKRQRKKNQARLIFVASLLVIAIAGWFTWAFFNRFEFKENYASFTVKDGWPVGIGKELNDNDKGKMPVFYQLVRYGWNRPNTRVNVLNSQKKLSHNVFNESPLVGLYESEGSDEKARDFSKMQRQTSYWIYIPDNDGHVSRKTAFDIEGDELYSVQYFRSSVMSEDNSNESKSKQLWANYVDRDGKSMRIRDNGADRIHLLVDETTGYYTGYQFYSETGTPQPNYNGAYGYRYQLAEDGRILSKNPVDAFGDLMLGEGVKYEQFDDYGRWTKVSGGNAHYGKEMIVFSMQNRTDSLLFGDNGALTYHSETKDGSYRYYRYDREQIKETAVYKLENGKRILSYKQQVLPPTAENAILTKVFWADSIMPYRLKREENRKGVSIVAYFCGTDETGINMPMMIFAPEGQYHKTVTTTVEEDGFTKVTKDYYDNDGNLSAYCKVNRDVAYYNSNHEMRKHLQYKDGVVRYAYLNDYENGQIAAQSVMDEDSTSIRYPEWDNFQLCYYKMKLVYDFSKTLIAIKGVNEFGEESLITSGNRAYQISSVPSSKMKTLEDNVIIHGRQMYMESLQEIDNTRKVEYIHIRDKGGEWFKAGIRTGDLLVSEGTIMKVARPDVPKDTYDILTFTPAKGNSGAEHYPVYFTQKEMERFNQAISQ